MNSHSQARCIPKHVWHSPATNNTKVAYGDWNLTGMLNSSFGHQTPLVWGLDLSRSPQGAGGLGGLRFSGDISLHLGYYARVD